VDVQQCVSSRRIRVVTAATADEREQSILRREQLADDDLGQLLQEVEAGQRPEWRHRRQEPRLQTLLGRMEVASSTGRRAGAPLGVS
jgi:hypothetical protein